MSNWWDDVPDANPPLSASAGRAAAEATDPRFAPEQQFTPADESWWKMAPDAHRPLLEQGARIVGQFGQGANDALYRAAMTFPDASGWVAKKFGLVPPAAPSPSQTVATNPSPLMDLRFNPENKAERIAGDVGDAAGTVAGLAIPAAGVAGTASSPLVRGVAGTLASQPGMQLASNAAGNVVGDLSGNPYLGAATSLAVPFGANGAMRIPFSAPAKTGAEAERRALLADAQKEGIPVSFGNIMDSTPARMFESVLSKLPFVGNQQSKLIENSKTAFDTAALDRVPAAAGQGLDAATPGTVDMVKARIGKQFDNLQSNTTVNIDNQVGSDIAKAKADFSKQLESQMPQSITGKLDELAAAANANNQPGVTGVSIDGTTYKNIRSKLSAMLGSTSGTDRQAVGAMIDALDGAVQRSLPKDMVQDWKDARTSWRRMTMIGDAVDARNNGQTAVGHIPPGSLAARTGNDAEMSRLAQVGVKYVGDKTPDSGTAMRTLIHNAMGLGGIGAGALTFPMTTAALTAGGYATNAMLNNPYTRAALIARLQNSRNSVVNKGLVATLGAEQGLESQR